MKFNYVLFFKMFLLLFLLNLTMQFFNITGLPMYAISFLGGWYVIRFISYMEGQGPQHLFIPEDVKKEDKDEAQ